MPVRFLIVFVSLVLCMQIEFVLEYHVNFGNPDIDEKPPMSLEEMLQKAISSIDLAQFMFTLENVCDRIHCFCCHLN